MLTELEEDNREHEHEIGNDSNQHDPEAGLLTLSNHHSPTTTRTTPRRTHTTTSTTSTSPLTEKTTITVRRKRARETTRQKIATKKTLTFAFAITFLVSLVTYIVLLATKTGSGLMFHILSLIFILVLFGCLLHSAIRLIMLRRKRDARAWLRRTPSSSRSQNSSQASLTSRHGHVRSTSNQTRFPVKRTLSSSSNSSHDPEKATEVLIGSEEKLETTPKGKNLTGRTVTVPPPFYGCFRSSKRLNPNHLQHFADPSPVTPTYEEAMKDARNAVGYRSGTTEQAPTYASPRREASQIVDGVRTSRIHPLERERVVGLVGMAR
ncbi:hypothetical protein LTR66_016131 [Elasticomyces elasticus]|nr:hypothetical protein LTR66_016131 [Elasticomyces elasticus]